MLRFVVDSIHMDSTALGAKEKGRGTSFKGFFFFFHEQKRIFICAYGDTLNEIAEEKLTVDVKLLLKLKLFPTWYFQNLLVVTFCSSTNAAQTSYNNLLSPAARGRLLQVVVSCFCHNFANGFLIPCWFPCIVAMWGSMKKPLPRLFCMSLLNLKKKHWKSSSTEMEYSSLNHCNILSPKDHPSVQSPYQKGRRHNAIPNGNTNSGVPKFIQHLLADLYHLKRGQMETHPLHTSVFPVLPDLHEWH